MTATIGATASCDVPVSFDDTFAGDASVDWSVSVSSGVDGFNWMDGSPIELEFSALGDPSSFREFASAV